MPLHSITQCQDVISLSSFFLSTKYPPENSGLENPPFVDDFPGKTRFFPHLFVTQGIGQIAQIREMEHVMGCRELEEQLPNLNTV